MSSVVRNENEMLETVEGIEFAIFMASLNFGVALRQACRF